MSVLEKECIDNAIIVGHSFGGRVAMEITAKFPDVVKGLVLVDSAGLKPRRKPSYYIKIAIHKLLKKFGMTGLKGSKDYQVLSLIMKETFKNVVGYDQTCLLKDIKVPTAIFWGKDDKDTPFYMAKKLKKGIANSELFILQGGHYAYVDDLYKFESILSAFIVQVGEQCL